MSALDQLARALDPKAKRARNGSWSCRCPAHEDKHASLSLSEKDGRLLWRCHAGCSQVDVRAELQKRGLLGKANGADHTATPRPKTEQADDWRPIAPVPEGAPEPTFTHKLYGKPSRTWTYRDAAGRALFHVARFDPAGKRKQIIPRCWGTLNGKIGWHWRHPATPRPLYRLDELTARPADPVLVVEGEKTADAATAELLPGYVVTTWPGGSNATRMADWSTLKGRCIMIWPDHDEPGRKAAEAIGDALLGIAAEVRIVDPPADLPEGWDLADVAPDGLDVRALIDLAERHVDRLELLVEEAETDPGAPFESEAVDFLAALRDRDKAEFERARARLKKAGVRIGALDQEVERRKPEAGDDGASKGKALDLPEPDPWGEPVDGAALIAGLVEQIQRHVILSDHAVLGAALWVLHAHAHDAAFHSPRLTLTSPTMRCGKSTMLRTIGRLIPRPLPTANITPAAMFRVIEAAKPSLLIDEADSFAQEADELRGVINSSHCRLDAYVIRAVPAGDDYEARRFSTWAPMAIASIGKLAATIADRSIRIAMERKAPGQPVARMRADRDDGFGVLASKAARWVADHFEALRQADPEMPAALNDRQADNWRGLIGIADLCGGDWPARARAAALALSAIDEDADTIGVQLLASVRLAFGVARQISTENLLRHLHAMAEHPWCEYGRHRKPISPRQLASLLRPFGVTSATIRDGDDTSKGYKREQFESAWTRYLSVTTSQPTESGAFDDFPSVTPDPFVTDRNSKNSRQTATCDAVTDGKGVEPAEEGIEAPWADDPAEACNWNREDHEPPCCHCGEPILITEDRIGRDDGRLIHRRCFAAGFISSGGARP
jgi:hypothetical protein